MAKCFVFELFFFTVDRNEIFPNIVEEILEKFLNVEQNVKCFKHDEPCLYFALKMKLRFVCNADLKRSIAVIRWWRD